MKILYIDSRDVSLDEPFTVFYSQAGLPDLFKMLKTENNPPLFFLLVHSWIRLFGISAFSIRFLPFLFSSVTPLFLYATGKRFYNTGTGVIAALIFTFSNYHLLFAHEARVYSLFALLSTVSMYQFLKLTYDKKRLTLILLAFTNILLIYSHFFGFFVLIVQILCVLTMKDVRISLLKEYMLCTLVVIVSYMPYLQIFVSRFWTTSSNGTWVPGPVISDLYTMVWRFSNTPVTTVCFLFILFTAFLIFLFRRRTERDSADIRTRVLIIWFIFPYFLLFFVSFRMPMFLDRYLVFVSPAFYLLIAVSIAYIFKNRWAFYTLGSIAVFLMAITFRPQEKNQRKVRNAVELVKQLKSEKSMVFICPQWLDLGFSYYYNIDHFKDYKHLTKRLNGEGIFPINGIIQMDTITLNKAASVIYYQEWARLVDKEDQILRFLERHFSEHERIDKFEPIIIYNFHGMR